MSGLDDILMIGRLDELGFSKGLLDEEDPLKAYAQAPENEAISADVCREMPFIRGGMN